MILGRDFARIVPEKKRVVDEEGVVIAGAAVQKRGTKKALKWLGLA